MERAEGSADPAAPALQVLEPLVASDDVVINLSVDVSSVALIALCAERGALYLDTVRPHVPRGPHPRRLGRWRVAKHLICAA